MGCISPQKICEQLGLNYKEISQDRKDAGIPDPAEMAAQMGGMPGQPGAPGGDVGQAPTGESGDQPQGSDAANADSSGGGDFEFDESMFEDL
jgi:hypothetical protein